MTKKKSNVPPPPFQAADATRLLYDMQTETARTLAMDPRNLRLIAQEIVATPTGTDPDTELCELMTMALDQARMAQENGQRFGKECLDGSMAMTRCYVRAGLPVPEDLAPDEYAIAAAAPLISPDDNAHPEAVFAPILDNLLSTAGDDPSLLHEAFAEVLPRIPTGARYMLCKLATANPDTRFEPLGCAWLLDPTEPVRDGAMEGLRDRLAAGRLSAQAVSRLKILRTWLADESLRQRVDLLLKDAIRSGLASNHKAQPSHRVIGYVSSPIDGAGAQSLAIALRKGRTRSLAVVLLKPEFGVKDAYVAPCAGAAEQRGIMQQITDPENEGHEGHVSSDYIQAVLAFALTDGLAHGATPAPGLVDVVDICAIAKLRPADGASTQILLDRYDPDNLISSLSPEEYDALVAASANWPATYPILGSWFEENDDIFAGLGAKATKAARKKAIWAWLETRRDFWSSVIARTALLLRDRDEPLARSFAVTAHALTQGHALQRIPVMSLITAQTLDAFLATHAGPKTGMLAGDHDMFMTLLMQDMAPAPQRPAAGKNIRKQTPKKPK